MNAETYSQRITPTLRSPQMSMKKNVISILRKLSEICSHFLLTFLQNSLLPRVSHRYLTRNALLRRNRRIQTCIQRYRQRRKLDETRALIITKYFMLGGIEAATSKSFTGGLDTATIDNSTADEIAAIQATDFIRVGASNGKYFDPLKPEGWVVDFEGVVKGFL